MTEQPIPDRLLALLSDSERDALASGELDSVLDPTSAAPVLLQGAQEALWRREQEFRALVENAPDVIVRLGRDFRLQYGNPAFQRLAGVSADLVPGKLCSDLLPTALSEALEAACRRVAGTGMEEQVEIDWSGELAPRSFSARVAPELSESGAVESVLAILRDDTDRRLAGQQLQQSRDLLDGTLQGLSAHIAILDSEGRILAANEAWRRFAVENGLSHAEHGIGLNYVEIAERATGTDAEDGARVAAGICEVARGDRDEFSLEYPCNSPTETRWFAVRVTRFRGSGRARVIVAHENITKRKQAERALRESEERYRRLFENSVDGVMLTAPDGTIFRANPAACAMLGYTEEEIQALGRAGVVDHSDPRLPTAIEQRRRTGRFQGELRFRRKDGVLIPVEITTSVYQDGSGTERTSMVVRDITERKRAEAELQAAEAHYRRLVTTAPQGIYVLDAGGRFVEINPAGERLLERRAEDVLGHHIAEVIAPLELDSVGEAFATVITGESDNLQLETKLIRPTGEEREVTVSITAIREDGAIVGVHGIAQDVTEERAREERQRLLATALDQLREGIFLLTPTGEYRYVNETYRQIFGLGAADPAPARLGDLATDRETRQILRRILQTAKEQGRWSGRIERRVKDGRTIPLDVVLGRVDRGGDGTGLLFGIVQDATEHVEREQQLRRVERLASLGTLIGGVAHELNNPLHAIRNFAELMLLEEGQAGDPEGLEIIRREADRAAKIVSDLRLVARQTQESEGERRAICLNDVVRHVLRVRRYSLETGNVEVHQELAQELPLVLANRAEIEQVVMNLVVNAEQALAGQEGARRLILRTLRTPAGVTMHVVDSGRGISAEHLGLVFDPFFTTKSPGEGTGLGLSLVHSIVTEHGGTVQVESEPGKGAAFRVNLPCATSWEPTPEQSASATQARRLRVLVVDDEEAILRMSVRFLERLGYAVDTAAEGSDALQLLEARRYDVIISDLRMPGMGGEELLQRLRGDGLGMERRLIFITGDVAGPARITYEGVPVLSKPIDMQELARTVEAVAERRDSTVEEER